MELPGSGLLHYNLGDGWQAAPMEAVSGGLYDAVFPPSPCPAPIPRARPLTRPGSDPKSNLLPRWALAMERLV